MELHTYEAYRPFIEPGDVIAFSGVGFVPECIKLATDSPVSHVAVVLESKVQIGGAAQDGRIVSIIESTTLLGNGKNGVQVNRLRDRLAAEQGCAWLLPLSHAARARLDLAKMYDFLLRQEHDGYDYEGVAAFILRKLPIVGRLFHRADDKREFCSELVAEGFAAGNLLPGCDCYEMSPQGLCEQPIFEGYVQLGGPRVQIPRFSGGGVVQIG